MILSATQWTVDCQALLSLEFSRQPYWSGLPFPAPGDLPNRRMEPTSLVSPALAGGFFTTSTTAAAAKSLQSCDSVRPHRRQPTRLPCP